MAPDRPDSDNESLISIAGKVIGQESDEPCSNLSVEVVATAGPDSESGPVDRSHTTTDDSGRFALTLSPSESDPSQLVFIVKDDGTRIGRTVLEDPSDEIQIRIPVEGRTRNSRSGVLPTAVTVASGILAGCAAIFGGDDEETPTESDPGPGTPEASTATPAEVSLETETPPETATPADTPAETPRSTDTPDEPDTPADTSTPAKTPAETATPSAGGSGTGGGTGGGAGGGSSGPTAGEPPAQPGSVSATGQEDSIEVTWSTVPGATSYNLYWATTDDVSPATGTRIDVESPPHAHTGVRLGTTYHYVVTAENSAGESPASPTAQASIVEPPTLDSPDVSDRTTQTSTSDLASALYEGDDAIQTGADSDAIDDDRVAILRGKVKSRNPSPLANVTVSAPNHPEFGSTRTRDDGVFDMAVNGGSTITLRFERAGFLPVQRKVSVQPNSQPTVETVALVEQTSKSTSVELDTDEGQVARGRTVSDEDGQRQATVFVPPNTSARDTNDGTAFSTLEVRATEYTVGENGPQAMPDDLPGRVGYTYAVELAAAGSEGDGSGGGNTAFINSQNRGSVEFDQPVVEYEYNFLDFPVGSRVPIGFYDDDAGSWEGSDDGRVIEILDISGGRASIDVDGSGQPADQGQLDDLGVTDAELSTLADQYEPGDELWRTPIPHFSPWDCNWNAGPPLDAVPPIPDFEIKEPPGGPIDPESTPDEPPDTPEGESPEEQEEDDNCDE